jgi:hypothetical protein
MNLKHGSAVGMEIQFSTYPNFASAMRKGKSSTLKNGGGFECRIKSIRKLYAQYAKRIILIKGSARQEVIVISAKLLSVIRSLLNPMLQRCRRCLLTLTFILTSVSIPSPTK